MKQYITMILVTFGVLNITGCGDDSSGIAPHANNSGLAYSYPTGKLENYRDDCIHNNKIFADARLQSCLALATIQLERDNCNADYNSQTTQAPKNFDAAQLVNQRFLDDCVANIPSGNAEAVCVPHFEETLAFEASNCGHAQ